MSMWDGLTTGSDTRILVLGATNRPNDIDAAILRRMPKRFAIKLPDTQQRKNILTLVRIVLASSWTVIEDATRCSRISRSHQASPSILSCAKRPVSPEAISKRRVATLPWCVDPILHRSGLFIESSCRFPFVSTCAAIKLTANSTWKPSTLP